MHVAAGQGLLDLANVLLDYGADVNFHNSRSVRRHYRCGTPLRSTLYRNDDASLQMIDLFVEYGVDLEKRDVFLKTPLLFATRYYRVKTTRILIDHGSLVDAENGNGRTTLHQVATRRKEGLGIAKLLLDHIAPVNAQDNNNLTPLCMAARGYIDMVKLLLTYGARVNLPSRDGISPLHVAVTKKNVDIAKLLLGHGALVDTQDNYGNTPLHKAVALGLLPIAELLLTHGAQVNVPNERKEPLYMRLPNGSI